MTSLADQFFGPTDPGRDATSGAGAPEVLDTTAGPAAADPTLSPVHDEAAPHSPVPVVEHHARPARTPARNCL